MTCGLKILYRNGYSILYGDEINLLYNGYYRVRRGNTWYLADEDGDQIKLLDNGTWKCIRGNYVAYVE